MVHILQVLVCVVLVSTSRAVFYFNEARRTGLPEKKKIEASIEASAGQFSIFSKVES
jgi:hypothetical protein